MNKLELFNKIVTAITVQYNLETKPGAQDLDRKITITETDEYISYFFCDVGHRYSATIEAINAMKEKIATLGWKGDDVYQAMYQITTTYSTQLIRHAVSCFYDKVKDKISIRTREWGYEWAHRKGRLYPVARTIPAFCYSKHMYTFMRMRGQRGYQPRIAKGTNISCHYGNLILQTVCGIDYFPKVETLTRHYIGTKDDYNLIEKIHNCKIPKILKDLNCDPTELNVLYSSLANLNEVNTICQHISNLPTLEKENLRGGEHKIFGVHGSISNYNLLMKIISQMMLGSMEYDWLIYDWLKDFQALNKKTSLKIRSKKRIEDEHRKMSKERMIRGIKNIKVKKEYHDLFKDSDFDFELITNKNRLLQESMDQDHCVATYGHRINNGECAIFSFKWEGLSYTLQVDRDFTIAQFRGYRNQDVPEALFEKVQTYLQKYRKESVEEQVPIELPF
jgi:hypothetical protein